MSADAMEMATFTPAGSRWVLTYRVDLPVNRWDAWIAVTTRDGLRPWFPATIVGEWTPGRELAFTFPDEPDADPMRGEVTDVEPGRELAFTWEGDSLRITLEEHDAGTRLVFAASLDGRGRGARDGAGWHACLAELRESVGGYVEDADKDTGRLFGAYASALGPEASTALPPGGAST
ncbi:MAG: SRPBCC domain-containing protein [Arthrobacter sp.]|uniref:SRPBCC domain-containing protein n=1 Tax=Arthrobacter sp. TaxID=1667 RepID=UPI003475F6D3